MNIIFFVNISLPARMEVRGKLNGNGIRNVAFVRIRDKVASTLEMCDLFRTIH